MSIESEHRGILVVDFGSQVTKLIVRKLRELEIETILIPQVDFTLSYLRSHKFQGIILSGSPYSVSDKRSPKIDISIYDFGIPILGICYGGQLIAKNFGALVEEKSDSEYGSTIITKQQNSKLSDNFFGKNQTKKVWMSHSDTISAKTGSSKDTLKNIEIIATSEEKIAIFKVKSKHIYGMQFHPEVSHTDDGVITLRSFCEDICLIDTKFAYKDMIAEKVENIRQAVGKSEVICALSGGVDSAVTALLIHKAIGHSLKCVYIDNGFMRKSETDFVINTFRKNYNISLEHIDAKDEFLSSISGISDPEEKRKEIGKTFIKIFEEVAKRNTNSKIKFLAQGTLYPDVIESLANFHGPSATIKSHHNVGGLPKRMKLSLIEPLRDMFKDEVRVVGKSLGLTEEILLRHPFPGPGLAIRIPGVVDFEKLEILREADEVYINSLKKEGLYHEIWQAFAVLLPIKSVGVMGDERTHQYTCVLRAICSSDGMTASVYPFRSEYLERVSNLILNSVEGINRVLFDITSKPPATIEWE